ncbi:MGDG synthase family glycosyltransferase, partial [Piscibacillus halophilus]|uniref:MGDG synthase family glycosyltransferase n=1 Tax=Piscibacillus halophilus TaxID=571933 RepID=UPI003CCC96CB
VYTDYFINTIWGIKGVDLHLAPDAHIKQQLIEKGVDHHKIFVTGIPIHPLLQQSKTIKNPCNEKLNILVSGGSLGIGPIMQLTKKLNPNKINYYILCGKNETLYRKIKQLKAPNLIPLPYINSRQEMDELYQQSHGILTKPGGVTISEGLYKKIPIFIFNTLPGQEEVNLEYLKTEGLVFKIIDQRSDDSIDDQILSGLYSSHKMTIYHSRLNEYHKRISEDIPTTLNHMMKLYH